MRVLGWNTTETTNKDPPPPLPQAGSPTDAVETLRGRVVEAHNSSSGRDPAFASLMAEWDLIYSFKCMERAAAQEVEVQRTVSAILASRLTHALDEQKSMRAAVESKDAQLTAAVHELVTLRSHTGITQDVGSRLTALEKERNSLVTQLVELRTQYDTETAKLKEQVQSWEHSGRNTKSVEERLEQVSQELKERREQDTATERKLAEWKAKVGVALREAKEKERELNARIDELVFEARELKEERDDLSGKIRDKAEMVDREVQADETTVAGNASQSSMDVLISVRYFMPDETYLESKVSVKDCITIDELIEICCRKISIKANLSLDPTELCLVFAMANQIRSMQNMQNAKGGAFKKEYVLTGTRQLKSWTVFRQFIISNVAVVLCLETKRSASPKANFFSPKIHSKGLQSRTNSISSAAGFGLARTIGENSPCLDTTAEGG